MRSRWYSESYNVNRETLTYTADVDWSHPDQAAEMAEYFEFGAAARAVIRGAPSCRKASPQSFSAAPPWRSPSRDPAPF